MDVRTLFLQVFCALAGNSLVSPINLESKGAYLREEGFQEEVESAVLYTVLLNCVAVENTSLLKLFG